MVRQHVTEDFELSRRGQDRWHLEIKLEHSADRPWWMRQAFRLCTTKTRGPRATTFVSLLSSYIGGYDRGLIQQRKLEALRKIKTNRKTPR